MTQPYTPPTTIRIGSCSLCGGDVVIRQVVINGEGAGAWCQKCGAREKRADAIEMVKAP